MTARNSIARYFLGTSLLAFAATPVTAQEAPDPSNEADENVIVVSANKREESLQEVPIAITAITSDAIELQGISETADLAAIAPNVSVNGSVTNLTAAVVTIRGIPTPGDEGQGFDSPIGLYLDGVYLARQSAASFEVADIERVEILRGPQGTLFGRNTTGGAINYITRRPSYDPGLSVRAGYGNYDRQMLRLVGNTGDVGGFRLTAGFLYKSRDGIVDNLLEPEDSRDPGAYETLGFRAAVEVDLADNLLLTNIFDWTRTEGTPFANQLTGVGDGTFRPNVTVDGNTFAQVQPANVAGYLADSTIVEAGCGAPLDSVSLTRLDEICLDADDETTDKVYGNMTRLELDLDTVLVRSTTAFRWWRNEILGSDLDGMGSLNGPLMEIGGPNPLAFFSGMPTSVLTNVGIPAGTAAFLIANAGPVNNITHPLFFASNDRGQNQFSQEIEVVGGSGTSFEWVVGGFYFEEDGFERNPQQIGFVLDTNQIVYNTPAAEATLLGFMYPPATAAFLAPGFAADLRANNPAQFRLFPVNSTLDYTVEAQSYALYGQGTWRPGGPDAPLGITLGLRYTWDEKSVVRTQNGAAPFGVDQQAINRREASFSEPTGHITIDYQPSPDLNLYAKYARGYRSGGFNVRQNTQVDNPATPNIDETVPLIPFGEERINSFEVGAKSTFGPVRLNGAVFYNIYSDLQATVPVPIEGGGSFGTQVINAGEIEYLGLELEAVVELTDALTFDAALGLIDRTVNEFPAADINGDLQNIASIVRPGNAPSTTANAALTYSDYIGSGDTRLTARVGWNYTSSQTFFPNPLTAPFLDESSADSRSLFNAQLRLDGISIGNGPEFSVMLWGRNLTDEEYVSRGIDFGQLGYGSVIFGPPATYGIDIEFSF